MPRVIVAASINLDLTAYVPELPKPGETVLGSAVASSPGGKGLNQAVAAARLGAMTELVGYIGSDDAGMRVRAFLEGESIGLDGLCTLDAAPTGTALILVDRHSQNAIAVIPGANMAWPAALPAAFAPARGDLVVATLEIADHAIRHAFELARAVGATTVLNPAPARDVSPALLALADQLIVNEIELPMVLGRPVDASRLDEVAAAAGVLASGRQAVVATLGPAGAIIAAGGRTWHQPAPAVAATDTAAAGDCFIGAWCAALARGEDHRAAAVFANRAAALSVTRRGTATSLPRRAEIEAAFG